MHNLKQHLKVLHNLKQHLKVLKIEKETKKIQQETNASSSPISLRLSSSDPLIQQELWRSASPAPQSDHPCFYSCIIIGSGGANEACEEEGQEEARRAKPTKRPFFFGNALKNIYIYIYIYKY